MSVIAELDISRAIVDGYSRKLQSRLSSDVIVVGAGPAGLVAASRLARGGLSVCIVDKRLSPGGGMWGGAMGMNMLVVQDEALTLLEEHKVRHTKTAGELHLVDAAELASALCLQALQAGADLLNLVMVEDVSVHDGRVSGVVVNRTTLSGVLPVDPLTLRARAVIDATGHEAAVVVHLQRRGLLAGTLGAAQPCEGPMNASEGERFVVDRVGEVFPGLWVTGMSVCAIYHGPRMGPIFGGMMLSGERAAQLVSASLSQQGR